MRTILLLGLMLISFMSCSKTYYQHTGICESIEFQDVISELTPVFKDENMEITYLDKEVGYMKIKTEYKYDMWYDAVYYGKWYITFKNDTLEAIAILDQKVKGKYGTTTRYVDDLGDNTKSSFKFYWKVRDKLYDLCPEIELKMIGDEGNIIEPEAEIEEY